MRGQPTLGPDPDQRLQEMELRVAAALELVAATAADLTTVQDDLAAAQASLVTQAGQIETLQTDLDTLEEVVAELG